MAKSNEKNESIKLRKIGWSINDIAQKVGASKSTVSLWCRDVALSQDAISLIVKKSKRKSTDALLCYSEKIRKDRQD